MAVVGGVGLHDAYCQVTFDPSVLCRRDDGSFWRDPSNGCHVEDPRCRSLSADDECPTSERVSEGWRHSCSLLLFRAEVPPSGPEPYFTGDTPGRGDLGRR